MHAEYGTEPKVYYVPPMQPSAFDSEGRFSDRSRLPLDYLRSLFGPGVEAALETISTEMARRRAAETS